MGCGKKVKSAVSHQRLCKLHKDSRVYSVNV